MKVEKLIIVGGGTSAWLTAAYIQHNHPAISVTVIDKEVGNSIGVGEATLLSFQPFMEECGFPIKDWFTKIGAGYKTGIMFSNWRKEGDNIWHPFFKGNRKITDLYHLWDIWSNVQDLDFKTYATGQYSGSVLHNTIEPLEDSLASHIDCGRLVKYIQDKLVDKINTIKSEVVNIKKDKNNNIEFLELKDGTVISGDLYVDCTGFKSVLRQDSDRIDLEGRLFVNTAVVSHVPYQDRFNEFRSYADCEAVDHGWVWKIGIDDRIGSGMVFNRNITDIETAKDYFVDYWNDRIEKDKVRVLHWDPFYNKDMWSGNIVQIGLSAGFIEPLESTGIGLITHGVSQLSNALFEQWYTQNEVNNFNSQLITVFEDCIDFVSMHYANNPRTSEFWQYVKEKFVPSERMNHYIEKLLDPYNKVPVDSKFNYMFGGTSWSIMLQQLDYEIAPRKLIYDKEYSREVIIKNYVTNEKHKHIWSSHHSSEIDRLKEMASLDL